MSASTTAEAKGLFVSSPNGVRKVIRSYLKDTECSVWNTINLLALLYRKYDMVYDTDNVNFFKDQYSEELRQFTGGEQYECASEILTSLDRLFKMERIRLNYALPGSQ
ncbi:hypothetical protein BJV82DRAFT_576210 [Fennellomyces sp. T-0311]|nr:hypothetical protein BJV82DRAFT_576210 [Fennellomyces sp. T-0311]